MTKFTPEDLVRFLYQETSPQKTAAIEAALESDWRLRESFDQLKAVHRNLHTTQIAPREEVVDRILQYSAKKVGHLHSH